MKYKNIEMLLDLCKVHNLKISEVAIKNTSKSMEISEEEVYSKMLDNLNIMKQSIKDGLKENLKSVSGLTGGGAFKLKKVVDDKKNITGSLMGEIIYSALSTAEVNACMGRIVAAPTAGSCGILPACLIALQNHYNFTDKEIVYALINASAVGKIISNNATVSGAEGGCQAECGSASAMIAAGITELFGGTPQMCADSAAQALKSHLGLVCDPVAGLVEEPCVIRNASSATIAITSAEITLAGIKSLIPLDEVIEAMLRVGNQMAPELKETALGGIAICKTAKSLESKIFGK